MLCVALPSMGPPSIYIYVHPIVYNLFTGGFDAMRRYFHSNWKKKVAAPQPENVCECVFGCVCDVRVCLFVDVFLFASV